MVVPTELDGPNPCSASNVENAMELLGQWSHVEFAVEGEKRQMML
jgi:hypothetical protein